MASSTKRERDENEPDSKKKYVLDKDAKQEKESDSNGDLDEEDANLKEEIGAAALTLSRIMFLRSMESETVTDEDADASKEINSYEKQEIDLNQEPEPDDDTNQEQQQQEAAVNDRNRRLEEEAAVASALATSEAEKEWAKKWKMGPEDDSEATFALLRRWNTPLIPPGKIIPRVLVEQCSRAIRKQLTVSDLSGGKQSRLVLAKSQVEKKFMPLLEESEIPRGKEGIRIPVYGPDGKVHEMKMWADEKTADLTTGWRKFVGDYELKENCDFITIWMFRHTENLRICFAIDCKRLSLRNQVSKRISKAVFEDSD